MKQEINLSDFLRSGYFGEVTLGNSLEDTLFKLGQPNCQTPLNKTTTLVSYGSYEFTYKKGILVSIQNDRFDIKHPELMEFENESITIRSEFLSADKIKYKKEIIKELELAGIRYSTIDYFDRIAIQTEDNIILDFNNEYWCDTTHQMSYIADESMYEFFGLRLHDNQ